MDHAVAVQRIFEHVENDAVDKAVMACLRLARNVNDCLSAAIFLREFCADKAQSDRSMYDDLQHLKPEAQKYIAKKSFEIWLAGRKLDYSPMVGGEHEDKTVSVTGIADIDAEIARNDDALADFVVPAGMSAYDTAAFAASAAEMKGKIRLYAKSLREIRSRIKLRCFNYATEVERQLKRQEQSESFLQSTQSTVHVYFRAHCPAVLEKLEKATQLIDSTNPEDFALLLTAVRRAIKGAADHFYPASEAPVICADGKTRTFTDEQYLNRLQQFVTVTFASSTSTDMLRAELEYLLVFARKLNEIASKGVHANVTFEEAKQGLLGLYLFLYNVVSRLQGASYGKNEQDTTEAPA